MSNGGGGVVPGGGDIKTGSSSTKTPTPDGGPIIKESQESEEYQQDLKVVVGTTIGVIVFVGLVMVAVLLYRVYRARQRALAYIHHNDDSLDRNLPLDIGGEKCQPTIFLLYANDCQLHQRVVEALAGFLMEVCGVTITLDLLEEADIIDRGIDDWLVDRLQEADYIMVLCSLGARLRCSKKYVRFKPIGQHLLPDYFSIAVDYVAEKMRVEKQKGLCTDKFLVVYMDYSTQSDIPPQLETAARFCLMKDIHKLHTHLKTCGPESVKSDSGSQHSNSGGGGDCESHYHETETGALLKATIEQTKTYFKDNPSWMDDQLEQSSSSVPHWVGVGKSSSRKRQHNSIEEPLLLLTNSIPPSQSMGDFELNNTQQQSSTSNTRWSSKLSTGVDMNVINPVSSSMVDISDPHYHDYRQHRQHPYVHSNKNGHSKSGIFQARQNSLPSSLASSGLIPSPSKKSQQVFRSMDNFCVDSNGDRRTPADHDGVPCLFCGYCHMEGVPECKLLDTPSSLPNCLKHDDNINYDSVHNLNTSSINPFSHSQTILQAEVHQEWGTPVRKQHPKDVNNISNGKFNTYGGHLRHWDSDHDVAQVLPPAYKSLPPNQLPPPPTSMLSQWDELGFKGKIHKWDNRYIPESPDLSQQRTEKQNGIGINGNFYHLRSRTLSQSSIYTNGSDSVSSDADSLKRDLQSIQNISSFQDFVNSSLFVSQSRTSDRLPSVTHIIPSLTSSDLLKPFQNFSPPLVENKKKFGKSNGLEIEMTGVDEIQNV